MNNPISTPLIELRVWRQFSVLAQELHFGRAATLLHMTQPPLTQAIAQLERALGVQLFERTKRSVHLTAAGQALLPLALDVLARARELTTTAQALAIGNAGHLKLAFVSTVGYALLPQWVMAFRQACPHVELELVEATSDVQLQALAQGDIDAGFMLHAPGFAPQGLGCLRVATEPLVLALPEQHPLAQKKTLRLGDVWSAPLVSFPRHSVPSLFDALFAMYHGAEQVPHIAQEAVQMQTIVNLVSAGLGVAWVPASVQQFQRSGVVYRSVDGAVPKCETSLVWHKSSPALARFVEFAPAYSHPNKAQSSYVDTSSN